MTDVIQSIISIKQQNFPDHSDTYTEEWVISQCAHLNISPEEYIGKLLRARAITESLRDVEIDESWLDKLPEEAKAMYKDKFSGPVG